LLAFSDKFFVFEMLLDLSIVCAFLVFIYVGSMDLFRDSVYKLDKYALVFMVYVLLLVVYVCFRCSYAYYFLLKGLFPLGLSYIFA